MQHKSTFSGSLRLFAATTLLLLTLSVHHPVWSWDDTGHLLVAQIAYDTMPREIALRVQEKLKPLPQGFGPYNFITAACWMDDIKRNPQNPWKELSALHYVDIPYSDGGHQFQIPDGNNAITALQQTLKDIPKSTFDKDLQARQWAMVMHLVGDLHNPLHCTDHHDRGGNDVLIAGIPNLPENPKTHNLHFFWDSAYRYDVVDGKVRQLYTGVSTKQRPAKLNEGFIAWQAWRLLQKYPPQKIKGYNDTEIVDWARESYEIACNSTYAPVMKTETRPLFLDAEYVHNAHEIAAQRIILAGVRLGRLLQELETKK